MPCKKKNHFLSGARQDKKQEFLLLVKITIQHYGAYAQKSWGVEIIFSGRRGYLEQSLMKKEKISKKVFSCLNSQNMAHKRLSPRISASVLYTCVGTIVYLSIPDLGCVRIVDNTISFLIMESNQDIF
ncbi:hypothetical protein PPYR_07993 [Photinus pyralis]|uniref:Uncharacterized protein n=1 Tax=Photinus pyralis TaxID=7054 RepID=A0A5N4AS64_PHOPY|nr:hypothetical protein PPYR_07993 [Photinus pyralis]